MADKVDIDIIINTDVSKMDNSQLSKFTGSVSKYIKSLNDLDLSQEIGSLETFATAIQNTSKALQSDQNTIAQYQAQLKSLGQSVRSNRQLFAKYDSTAGVQKELLYAQADLKNAKEDLNKAFESGNEAGVDKYLERIDSLNKKIAELKRAEKQMANSDEVAIKYAETRQALESAKQQYADTQQALENFRNTYASVYSKLQDDVQEYVDTQEEAQQEEDAESEARERSVKRHQLLRNSFNTLKSAISGVVGMYARLGSAMIKHFKNKAEKSTKSVGKMTKKILMLGLGARSLFLLFRRLRTAFVKAFPDMAKKVPEINKEFSAMKVATANLKGAFVTAFEPLRMVAMPIIRQVANAITSLINLVAKFNAVLTGKALYKATAGMYDYARSRSNANKLFTASFDTLNQIGDSGGGNKEPELTYEQVTVDADDAVSIFAQKVKEAWANGNFYEIGYLVAEWMTKAFNKATELIETTINDFAVKIATSVSTFINGAIAKLDLAEAFGHLKRSKFNLLFNTIYTMLSKISWYRLGTFIATGLMSFIHNLDVKKIAQTINTLFHSISEFIFGFFDGIDWDEAWSQVFNFVSELDIGQIIADVILIAGRITLALFEAIKSGLKQLGIFNFISTQIIEPWQETVANGGSVWDAIVVVGENIIEGLKQGLSNIISNVAEWLRELVTDPIIKKFKELFGIHSPSTVFEEFGKFIIEGFVDGLVKKLESIKQFFSDLLKLMRDSVQDITDAIWEKIKGGINTVLSGVQFLVDGIVKGINSAIDAINGFGFDIPSPIADFFNLPSSFHLSIPHISGPQIPLLARGAVIPPNAPFMAVLGDQKNGTNIETPLETMIEAFRIAQADQQININFTGSLAQLGRVLKPVIDKENSRVGGSLVKGGIR